MKNVRRSTTDGGMAVLETALCLILFVFIVLATSALFFFLFNQQVIEHSVYANAAKVKTVPYRISTQDGDLSYYLVTADLERSINDAADAVMTALQNELIGIDEGSLTVQVGYLQLTERSGTFSVSHQSATTRGNAQHASSLTDFSASRLTQTMTGIDSSGGSGPAPVLLRVRVHLLTEPFTRFDLLRVVPSAIEFDVMIPLRQQAGLLARADATGESNQMRMS